MLIFTRGRNISKAMSKPACKKVSRMTGKEEDIVTTILDVSRRSSARKLETIPESVGNLQCQKEGSQTIHCKDMQEKGLFQTNI